MAQVTKRGAELAKGLFPPETEGFKWREVAVTCSLIARHAQTLHAYAELACNREMTVAEIKREEDLMARVLRLVCELGDGFRVRFNSDPRGFAVKIQNPMGRYNTWGGAEDGWGV